jgi:hypothetical protein
MPSSPPIKSPAQGRPCGSLRVGLGRVAALAVAVLVLVSTATAGSTYLWCAAMGRAMSVCCTAGDHDDELAPGQDEHVRLSRPCCERRTTGDRTKARIHRSQSEVPPPLATLAPALLPIERPAPRASLVQAPLPAPRPGSPIRAGPGVALDACIRLQVFRC